MKHKYKKAIAYFLLNVFAFGFIVGCQQNKTEGDIIPKVKVEKLTIEEENFLDELDLMISKTIKESDNKGLMAKSNNQIDPSNPNNPYDYIGKNVESIFNCVMPHLKEAKSGDINDCPSKILNECSKTGECVCHGEEENIRKLLFECYTNETGDVVNPSNIPSWLTISNMDPIVEINNSQLSTFGKKIASKYINTMVNLQNANAMVNVSIGFENKVNNSNLLSTNDKKQIVTEITTKKHIVAYLDNNSSTTGGTQPLNGPRFWTWLGGVILSSILWTISLL